MAGHSAYGAGNIDFSVLVPQYTHEAERGHQAFISTGDFSVGGGAGLPLDLSRDLPAPFSVFHGTGTFFCADS